MFIPSLKKHANEFMRSIRNGRYEDVGDGCILMIDQHAYLGGVLGIARNGGPMDYGNNLVVSAARTYGLLAMLLKGSQFGPWYFVPFATNTAVPDNLTSANFNSTLTEFTNYAEAPNRQVWNGVNTGSVITNSASMAVITIGSGGQDSVYGAGLSSVITVGASTGLIFCAALAGTAKVGLEPGETLTFSYGITAAST